MYAKLLARDFAIATGAVLLWKLGSGFSGGQGPASDLTGVVVGLLLGACSFVLHEWGHLLGALAARSRVRPAERLGSLFIFSFDSRRNSQRQFLALSIGGWVATAVAVWAAYALLPSHLLAAHVARGVALVSALLVVVIEVPLVAWSLWTGRVPRVDTQPIGRETEGAAACPG